jgi:hypothetical protein
MLMLQYAVELLAFHCWQVQQRLGPAVIVAAGSRLYQPRCLLISDALPEDTSVSSWCGLHARRHA